jgi:ATP-dependent RNA helicase DeaD
MTAPQTDKTATLFSDLGLAEAVVRAVKAIGYEAASPIQAATIPALLEGADILGQAQTGTGKTAAFALPILSRLDMKKRAPQALVLVPTRELAIQVSEAFQKYAAGQHAFHVLPIYGGQSYVPQLNALKRGPQVIVGTPGRIIDHLDRRTLRLDDIRCLVLDEADEMLAMGFADAMEAILAQTPADKQVALFSATMAPNIRCIAQTHLKNPREIVIKGKTSTAANIKQSFWMVSGLHKLDALTRIVEVADFDAMLVFVRTKQSTVDLAERLQARGFAAVALNGDIQQSVREKTVQQLKDGKIDILVATDVAARGLDVKRITHVVNFDVPYDTESYVHRIGRTGRAGRSGEAILFIAPRERNLLRLIEKHTRQTIEPLSLPTVDDVNARKLAKFKARIGEALATGPVDFFRKAVQEVALETGADLLSVAAAVASLVEGGTPVQSTAPSQTYASPNFARGGDDAPRKPKREREPAADLPAVAESDFAFEDDGKQITWKLAVGHQHGAKPGNIVGAIANEARLAGPQINGVDIRGSYSLVRLPANLSKSVIERLSKVRVRGQALNLEESNSPPPRGKPKAFKKVYEKPYAKPFRKGGKRPE